jgi:hypothetical protein
MEDRNVNTITKRVTVGSDHQIRIELEVPADFPEGEAEMTIDLKPVVAIESRNRAREIYGKGKGKSWMSVDFDAPLEDFAKYM